MYLFQICSFSNITLKIRGIGFNHILGYKNISIKFPIHLYPKEIYINGYKQENVNYSYDFNETINIVEMIWDNHINNTNYMFYECSNITEMNLYNFDTSQVDTMKHMFSGCSSLISLDFSNFNTSLVETMEYMFYGCSSLIFLDLSSFDTSQVFWMENMFHGCSSLISLNLSSFNTSQVEYMKYMFYGCSSLSSLDLSNFNVSSLTDTQYMFYKCSSLISLNLSNFDTSSVSYTNYMFSNCQKLEYINLQNFNEIKIISDYCCLNMFENIPNNVVICINESINQKYIFPQIKNITNYTIDCSDKCNLEKCKSCSPASSKRDLCIQCDIANGYYPMENDSSNIREYINCYNQLLGYYLDSFGSFFKKCFYSCKTCQKEGNESYHNCIECKENYIYEVNCNNYKNCYESEPSIHINNSLIKYTTGNLGESSEFPETNDFSSKNKMTHILINNENRNKIQKKIITTFNTEVIYECLSDENSLNINCIFVNVTNNTEILNIIRDNISTIYDLENKKSQIIQVDENIIYQITNNKNELELLKGGFLNNQNLSILDLGQCETTLKETYHINESDYLIYIKREKINIKASEKDIQYEVYDPYNITKLNLSYCKGDIINIYTKTELSEETNEIYEQMKSMGYNMLDINDPFYQDICTPFKYLYDNDIILSDRIKYIYYNNDSQCLSNCDFSFYLSNSLYLNCTCEVILEEKGNEAKFSGKKIYESFYDVLKYSNFKVLKCYKLIFNASIFKKNSGMFTIITMFSIYLSSLIICIIKRISPLLIILEKIASKKDKKSSEIVVFTRKKKSCKTFKKKRHKMILSSPPNKKRLSKKRHTNETNKVKNFDKDKEISSVMKSLKEEKKVEPKKLDAFELNELEFEDAITQDKRTFIQIYWNLLCREHRIIFTFLICNDYNLLYIKFARFIFLVASDIAINVFFFSDDSMHKIFLNYGKYDFLQQIPQIIYTTIISQLLEVFLCYLSLTDKHIYQIKNLKQPDEKEKILKCIKLKLSGFFVFTFIVFGFYCYAVGAFCAVYQNTQLIFLKDSLFSFLLGLLYPFALYLFPTGLRILSFKFRIKCMYILSDIIPFF